MKQFLSAKSSCTFPLIPRLTWLELLHKSWPLLQTSSHFLAQSWAEHWVHAPECQGLVMKFIFQKDEILAKVNVLKTWLLCSVIHISSPCLFLFFLRLWRPLGLHDFIHDLKRNGRSCCSSFMTAVFSHSSQISKCQKYLTFIYLECFFWGWARILCLAKRNHVPAMVSNLACKKWLSTWQF